MSRTGLLGVNRAYRNVYTEALCVLAVVPPIHLAIISTHGKFEVIHDRGSIVYKDNEITKENMMTNLKTYD